MLVAHIRRHLEGGELVAAQTVGDAAALHREHLVTDLVPFDARAHAHDLARALDSHSTPKGRALVREQRQPPEAHHDVTEVKRGALDSDLDVVRAELGQGQRAELQVGDGARVVSGQTEGARRVRGQMGDRGRLAQVVQPTRPQPAVTDRELTFTQWREVRDKGEVGDGAEIDQPEVDLACIAQLKGEGAHRPPHARLRGGGHLEHRARGEHGEDARRRVRIARALRHKLLAPLGQCGGRVVETVRRTDGRDVLGRAQRGEIVDARPRSRLSKLVRRRLATEDCTPRLCIAKGVVDHDVRCERLGGSRPRRGRWHGHKLNRGDEQLDAQRNGHRGIGVGIGGGRCWRRGGRLIQGGEARREGRLRRPEHLEKEKSTRGDKLCMHRELVCEGGAVGNRAHPHDEQLKHRRPEQAVG